MFIFVVFLCVVLRVVLCDVTGSLLGVFIFVVILFVVLGNVLNVTGCVCVLYHLGFLL